MRVLSTIPRTSVIEAYQSSSLLAPVDCAVVSTTGCNWLPWFLDRFVGPHSRCFAQSGRTRWFRYVPHRSVHVHSQHYTSFLGNRRTLAKILFMLVVLLFFLPFVVFE